MVREAIDGSPRLYFDPGWSAAAAGHEALFQNPCEPGNRRFLKQPTQRQVNPKTFSYPGRESRRE